MRAISFTKYGGPDVMKLQDLPQPVPEANQVLIRAVTAGLNPVDALQRQGTFRLAHPYTFPKIAGNELSGVVEFVGSLVREFQPGDHVMTRTGSEQLSALADYVAVDQDFVARAPQNIPLSDAAAIPLAGLTAQQALGPEHLGLQAGEHLLITGGAGGVGLLAIQLAKLKGAHVTTTASSAGEKLVREAGADHVINYRERKISDGVERFTKVLDLVGGDTVTDLMAAVERGGAVVSIAGPPTPGSLAGDTDLSRSKAALVRGVEELLSFRMRRLAKKAGVTYEFFLMHSDGAGLTKLASLVDQGELRATIDSRYPFDQFRDAFEQLESRRSKGKVLVEISA